MYILNIQKMYMYTYWMYYRGVSRIKQKLLKEGRLAICEK